MVGYILGLGDRHPNNLLLNRNTGKVIHIDFGDCFEVAMHREKFAEKVPFRLTRMLVNAMEVSGIEGNFRTTCESVMKVLRENKESIMAVLEAFVYDPLINWRLITNPTSPGNTNSRRMFPFCPALFLFSYFSLFFHALYMCTCIVLMKDNIYMIRDVLLLC
jgi:FKBP12-rapamycin complex-associated protein